MKFRNHLLALSVAFAVIACGDSGSSFQEATGKGTIRAIHAMKSVPEVNFRIEELSLGGIDYRQVSGLAEYDDLTYDFNFDLRITGDLTETRIATQEVDIEVDRDYILLLSGSLAAPTVTVWDTAERDFDGTETIFEARFAHTAESLGSIDFYFAAEGVAPVSGEEIGTLNFGEVLPAVDYTPGEFVLTATTSGDPNDILFQSAVTTFAAATQYTVPLFDAGFNTKAPFIGRSYSVGANGAAGTSTIPDANYPAEIEFVNASMPLGSVDIYDDEMQTSRIVDDLAHTGVTPQIGLMEGETTFYYTPSATNQPVLIEQAVNFFIGIRGRVVAVGDVDDFRTVSYVADRRPLETAAKFQVFNSSLNFDFISVFAVEPDEVLEDQFAFLPSVPTANSSQVVALEAGSYDIYVRELGGTENLAGPIRFDLENGDIVSGMIFDTVDPAVVELQTIPLN